MFHVFQLGVCLTVLVAVVGCASGVTRFQLMSAGHTGCAPEANVITNIRGTTSAEGWTWNAACKDKTFMCSEALSGGSGSCAPVVK